MTAARRQSLRSTARRAGLAGAVCLVLWAALAAAAPAAAWPAYRLAAFACLQPALGCLFFKLIHRITGGQWGEGLAPFLDAGVRLLPWIWPLIAVLLFVPQAKPSFAATGFPGHTALVVRAIFYELVFIAISGVALGRWRPRLAAPCLIALVLTMHFLAADWFFTLEPGWYSSGFPFVWMSLQALAGLALAIVAASACGHDPGVKGSSGRAVGLDWGDLILTTVVFSTYVAFVEFLIIWSGDLPREIAWYVRRSAGGWKWVLVFLGLFHLAFPLGFMLFRDLKRSRHGVPLVAAILCGVEAVWTAWFILPAFPDRGAWFVPACLLGVAGGAGLFLNRYLAAALRGEETA